MKFWRNGFAYDDDLLSVGRDMWLRYWNVVRPTWPVWLFISIAILLLLRTGQGRELLYAVADPCAQIDGADVAAAWGDVASRCSAAGVNWQFVATFIAVLFTSFATFVICLISVRRYYGFSYRAPQGFPVRFRSAFAAALMIPATLVYFYGFVIEAWPALLAALLVVVALGVLFEFIRRRALHVYVSPFSSIIVLGRIGRAVLNTLAAIAFISTAVLAFLPDAAGPIARFLGPVGIMLCGLTAWAALLTFLVSALEHRRWPPAIFIVPVIALAIAVFDRVLEGDAHDVRQVQLATPAPARPTAEQYANDWLATHPVIEGRRQRAVIVLAEGGGIRSAVQTASTLAQLEAAGAEHHADFYNDLYALSGVSGGSVGIAAYLAAHRVPETPAARVVRLHDFLKLDHFTPLLAGLFFGDAFSFIPTLSDRAARFEQSLGRPWGPGAPNAMALPFGEAIGANAPIVIFNTVRANDGGLDVVSNVDFPDSRVCNVLQRIGPNHTLALSTAAGLSARFPIVSPPGVISAPPATACGEQPGADPDRVSVIRYVDGGYLDNSGAISALAAVRQLRSAALALGRQDIDIIVVHIYARDLVSTREGDLASTNDLLPEFTAPFSAFMEARRRHGLTPVENLCRSIVREPRESVCADLSTYRTARAGENGADAPSVVSAPCAAGLPWFNAHLDIAAKTQDRRYVPLGWVLGRSRSYVESEAAKTAREVSDVLYPSTALQTPPCNGPPASG